MTTPPLLPSLPGLTWSRHKLPKFNTRVASHTSGREVRVPLMAYPLYEFEAKYSGLTSSSSLFAGLGTQSLQALMGFFLQLQGQYGTFLYADPDDSTATGQVIGLGDGSTTSFLVARTLGGWNEPVGWVTAVANVYLNGVAQSASSFTFIAPNTIVLASAPGAGVFVSADFSFAFNCRFLDDQMDFEEFMSSLWQLDSMKFRSVKANTTPATLAAPWTIPYTIGGTLPTIFADWTTEGGANHYLYNGTAYGSFAALLAAVGGTFTAGQIGSGGKYVTNVSGNLAQTTAGALPLNYSVTSVGTLLGLLLEGPSSNVLLQSNNFSNAYWNESNQVTLTGSYGTSPDGTTDSWRVQGTGSGWFLGTSSLPAAGTYTISCWVKSNTGSNQKFCFVLGAAGDGPDQTATTSWQRFSFTASPSSSGSITGLHVDSSGDTVDLQIFGMQCEPGSVASSYMPTTSSTASRTADLLRFPWTATTATFRLNIAAISGFASNADPYLADTQQVIIADNGGSATSVLTDNQAGQTLSTSVNALTSAANIIGAGGSLTGRLLSANGNAAVSDGNAFRGPLAPSRFFIGTDVAGGYGFGTYAQLGVWPFAMTAAQIAAMTGTA